MPPPYLQLSAYEVVLYWARTLDLLLSIIYSDLAAVLPDFCLAMPMIGHEPFWMQSSFSATELQPQNRAAIFNHCAFHPSVLWNMGVWRVVVKNQWKTLLGFVALFLRLCLSAVTNCLYVTKGRSGTDNLFLQTVALETLEVGSTIRRDKGRRGDHKGEKQNVENHQNRVKRKL